MPKFIPVTLKTILSRVVAGLRGPAPEKSNGQATTDSAIAAVVQPEPISQLDELVKDMLDDYQVVFTLDVLIASLKRAEVSITLSSDEPAAESSADDVGPSGGASDEPDDPMATAVAADLTRLWADTLPKILDKREGVLSYGRCAFEKFWENDLEQGITRIRSLELLPATDEGLKATEMKLTENGDFDGIKLTIGGEEIDIVAERSWWCAIGATKLRPYGRSLFIGAPAEVRKQRKRLFSLTEGYIRRWAIKPPVIHAPSKAQDVNGQVIDNHERIVRTLMKSWEYGNPPIFPNDRNAAGEYLTDITHEQDTVDPSPVTAIADMLDAQQSRAFGVHEKITSEGAEVGSHAAQLMHVAIMLSICDGLMAQLTGSFSKYVAEKVVAQNWSANAPKLTVAAVSLLSDAFVMELANALLTSPQWSPLMAAGVVNIEAILLSSGVPLTADAKTRIEEALEIARAQKQQMPPGQQAGDEDGEETGSELDTSDEDPLFGNLSARGNGNDDLLLSQFKGRGGGTGTNQYGIKGRGATRSKKNV